MTLAASMNENPVDSLLSDPSVQTVRRLVAVVVTHNRLNKLQPTLKRLFDTDPAELEAVVVVDNASTDGTADWLASLNEPRLDIVTAKSNLGGAGGFETGMRHAVGRHDPDWLVIMDDDARPAPETLSAFHALPPGQWDAIAAAVYFPDGRICEMNRPSRNPFGDWRLFLRTVRMGRNGFHIPHDEYEKPGCAIDVTSFVGFFISRRAIELAGYPDGRLFLYGDDGLYTLGLSRAGGRIGFLPQLRFEHDFTTFGGPGLAKGQRFVPLWKVYYHHRNLLLLYRLAAGWLFWPALLVVLPKWYSKVRHHGGARREFLRLMNRAVADGLRRKLGSNHAQIVDLAGQAKS